MAYQSLYRKYRPKRFSEVVGQDAIVRTLGNQVKTGKLAHAYLFTGTRGTGKTTVARILARAVNCENVQPDGSPCCECEMCRGIEDGTLMNVIEIDGASNNGVENVRAIIEEISYSPQRGNKKIYIIDEVHMLAAGQGAAFNALLKTLEEPSPGTILMLVCESDERMLSTIRSRVQTIKVKSEGLKS